MTAMTRLVTWLTISKAIKAAGGMVPFVKNMHDDLGYVCKFYLVPNQPVVSINDPQLLKNTLKMGSRPIEMFKFLEPLLGPDNLQVSKRCITATIALDDQIRTNQSDPPSPTKRNLKMGRFVWL
jgi:hypothetical protein